MRMNHAAPSEYLRKAETVLLKGVELPRDSIKHEVKLSRLARGLPELGVPRRLEDPLVGIHGLLVYVEEAERGALREHGININSARAFFTHLKTMDVVA